jgi:dolichol-phosphate mannosyltransferase
MIYFLVPVFNEAENLSILIPNLLNLVNRLDLKEYFFVFSDDGSKDNSGQIISALLPENKHKILGDGTNNGPGFAFNIGFEWILTHSTDDQDIIITLEADNTSDLSLIHQMLTVNQLGFNLVLASVYAQGGGFDQTTFIRKFLSSIANLFFRFLFDLKVLTLSSFYRLYEVDLLRKIKSKGNIIDEKGFICMLEILLKAANCQAKILELPMELKSNNRIGKSKLKVMKTTVSYFEFLFKAKVKGY